MDRIAIAENLVRLTRSLVSGLYSDVADSEPEEIAGHFAEMIHRQRGLRNVARVKIAHRGDYVLLSGEIAKTPHAVGSPALEGSGIGVKVDFSVRGGRGVAQIRIWIEGRMVEKNVDMSRKSDTTERWLLNVRSFINQLVNLHMG